MRFFAEFTLSGVRFVASLRMTKSEGPGMTPLFCHCEADFVSRSNLVEGQEIAAHLSGAHSDIRGFSLVLHDPERSQLQAIEEIVSLID